MSATTETEQIQRSADAQSPENLSQEVAFEILSNRRRRHVLHLLKQREDPVTLRETSLQTAAWENNISPEEISYEQRTRVYTALRQAHLPKMDDAGVVKFDPDAGTVELTEGAAELEVYLDVVPHNEIPWSKYYVGLGVVCSGLASAALLDIFPFSLLPSIAYAWLIALLLLTSALVHRYRDKQNRLGSEGPPPMTTYDREST